MSKNYKKKLKQKLKKKEQKIIQLRNELDKLTDDIHQMEERYIKKINGVDYDTDWEDKIDEDSIFDEFVRLKFLSGSSLCHRCFAHIDIEDNNCKTCTSNEREEK